MFTLFEYKKLTDDLNHLLILEGSSISATAKRCAPIRLYPSIIIIADRIIIVEAIVKGRSNIPKRVEPIAGIIPIRPSNSSAATIIIITRT
mgnify:CR=1 FL=1